MRRWFLLGCLCGALGCLLGCSTAAKPIPVSGTVNLDGQPLAEGQVTLLGEKTAPETFTVKAGSFQGEAKPGKKRVEIRAFKLGKPTKMGDTEIEATPENYIPAKYNTESTLTAEVAAGGLNPNKFDVQSH